MTTSEPAPKRHYDNRRRRELAAHTRDRIIDAGTDLVRESLRDWRGVTVAAVADRSGVHQRTVYRHFANERALRDAVMHRLERQAGVDLAELRLDGVAEAAARILRFVAACSLDEPPPLDPTLIDANRRQHDALLAAVKQDADRWPSGDRRIAAAVLDVLWAVGSYERLINDWGLDQDEAIRGITWAIRLVEQAVRDDQRPGRRRHPGRESRPNG